MRGRWWFGTGLAVTALAAVLAHADGPSDSTEGPRRAPNAPDQGALPLVLSIRALSMGQASLTDTGDVERVQSSNGAGTSRWPSATTPIGRGVYISVMPACIPGVDEPLWPGSRGNSVRRR